MELSTPAEQDGIASQDAQVPSSCHLVHHVERHAFLPGAVTTVMHSLQSQDGKSSLVAMGLETGSIAVHDISIDPSINIKPLSLYPLHRFPTGVTSPCTAIAPQPTSSSQQEIMSVGEDGAVAFTHLLTGQSNRTGRSVHERVRDNIYSPYLSLLCSISSS